jgi:hypothetical protein
MTAPESKQSSLNDFRLLLSKLTGNPDIVSRELICTPCGGNYGSLAAWVVSVNGSPPKGIIFIGQCRYSNADDVFLIYGAKSKRLGFAQANIVRRFEAVHLSKDDGHAMLEDYCVISIPGD